jgi:hypothetical protein
VPSAREMSWATLGFSAMMRVLFSSDKMCSLF